MTNSLPAGFWAHRVIKPHLCRCGESDPDRFPPRSKSVCIKCRSKSTGAKQRCLEKRRKSGIKPPCTTCGEERQEQLVFWNRRCLKCNWATRYGHECPHQINKKREKQYSMSNASESIDSNYIYRDDPVYGSWMNDSGIEPVGHKLLLEIPTPSDIKRAQDNGIEIPETALERHTQAAVVALVLQLGPDCYREKEKFQCGPWCKPGDFIAMSPYAGTRIKSPKTGKDYRFLYDDCIDGRVEGPEFLERG